MEYLGLLVMVESQSWRGKANPRKEEIREMSELLLMYKQRRCDVEEVRYTGSASAFLLYDDVHLGLTKSRASHVTN